MNFLIYRRGGYIRCITVGTISIHSDCKDHIHLIFCFRHLRHFNQCDRQSKTSGEPCMYGSCMVHAWFMYGSRLALYSFLCILKSVSIEFFVSATSSTSFSVFGSHSNSQMIYVWFMHGSSAWSMNHTWLVYGSLWICRDIELAETSDASRLALYSFLCILKSVSI